MAVSDSVQDEGLVRVIGGGAYVEEAFGPFVGFIASIQFWFGFSALVGSRVAIHVIHSIFRGRGKK